jgi:hypothetical protein
MFVTFDLGKPLANPTPRKTPKKSALKKKPASHDASSLLDQRPYLSKMVSTSPKIVPSSPPAPQPSDMAPQNPGHNKTVTWGKKLGSLNDGVMSQLAQ